MAAESTNNVPNAMPNDRSSENKQRPRTPTKRKPKKPKKRQDRAKLPWAHLEHIQNKITRLETQLHGIKELEAKQDQDSLTNDERQLLDSRQETTIALEQLKQLHSELGAPEMLRKMTDALPERPKKDEERAKTAAIRTEQHTMTLLHFFYVVRLAQKGFFSVLGDACPDVELNALVYLCDRVVGSSLFAAKHHSKEVRDEKHAGVFQMLAKLHNGVDESIDGFKTTYKQMKDLVTTLACNPTPTQLPATGSPTAPPVLLVIPFSGMIDVPTPLFNPTMPMMHAPAPNGAALDNQSEAAETAPLASAPQQDNITNVCSVSAEAEVEEKKTSPRADEIESTPISQNEDTLATDDPTSKTAIDTADQATENVTSTAEKPAETAEPSTAEEKAPTTDTQVASESWRQIPGSTRRHDLSNGSSESGGDRGSHRRRGHGRRRGGGGAHGKRDDHE